MTIFKNKNRVKMEYQRYSNNPEEAGKEKQRNKRHGNKQKQIIKWWSSIQTYQYLH